ncbi:MAG: 30S ribosomal protein S15 [Bacteroidota bacterium]
MTQKPAQKPEKEKESNFFEKYSPTKSDKDTGSPESQIALFTMRIKSLTEHLKVHKKDKDSLQRGLKKIVGKRQRQLKYLFKVSKERYQNICQSLSIKGIR